MASELKPLVHKKLDDLIQNLPNLSKYDTKILMKKSNEVYAEAERWLKKGDEENSYIMFFTYFRMVMHIRKSQEFKRDPTYYSLMMGVEKAKNALDTAEMLKDSLTKRYGETSTSTANAWQPPFTSSPEKRHSPTPGTGLITVTELLPLLQQQKVLVMDCRTREQFVASHISPFATLNVPAEIIRNGISAGKIQYELTASDKLHWASRLTKEHVVLMDWNSKPNMPGETIVTLKNILLKWDPDAVYHNPVRILANGYELFMHTYPMHTTDAKYQPRLEVITEVSSIGDIEYPDITIIEMKDTIKPPLDPMASMLKPNVDRSKKAAAVERYSKTVEEELMKSERTLQESIELAEKLTEAVDKVQQIPAGDVARKDEMLGQCIKLKNSLFENIDQRIFLDAHVHNLSDTMDESIASGGVPASANDQSKNLIKKHQARNAEHGLKLKALLDRLDKRGLLNIIHQMPDIPLQPIKPFVLRAKKPTQPVVQPTVQPAPDRPEIPPFVQPTAIQPPVVPAGFQPVVRPPIVRPPVRPAKPIYRMKRPELVNLSPMEKPINSQLRTLGLTGMSNIANSCYQNSVMQCFSNTTPLRDFFLLESGIVQQFEDTEDRAAAEQVWKVMLAIWSENKYAHIKTIDMRNMVNAKYQSFNNNEHQDAHEFLALLMQWLHQDLMVDTVPNIDIKNSADMDYAREIATSRHSEITKLFNIQTKSTLSCRQCKFESRSHFVSTNLTLEMTQDTTETNLTHCLKMHFGGDVAEWTCSKCSVNGEAIKKLDITKLPQILVLHLNRTTWINGVQGKNPKMISCPLNGLDMHPYLAPTEQKRNAPANCAYDLYGVINHVGAHIHQGHYFAHCKNSIDNRWYKFDDSVVSPLSERDVIKPQAYILFYQRKKHS